MNLHKRLKTSNPEYQMCEKNGSSLASSKVDFRCSAIRLSKVTGGFSDDQKAAIQEIGFGFLLHTPPLQLKKNLIFSLLEKCDPITRSITLKGIRIPVTTWDVKCLLGLQDEGKRIDFTRGLDLDINLLKNYVPTGGKGIPLDDLHRDISESRKADDHFKRKFALFIIGVILAPRTGQHIHVDYLKLVANVEEIPNFNWAAFTLDFLFDSIVKHQSGEAKWLQGCVLFLQLWYYEHLCFSRADYNRGPPTYPLMAYWDDKSARLWEMWEAKIGHEAGEVIVELSLPLLPLEAKGVDNREMLADSQKIKRKSTKKRKRVPKKSKKARMETLTTSTNVPNQFSDRREGEAARQGEAPGPIFQDSAMISQRLCALEKQVEIVKESMTKMGEKITGETAEIKGLLKEIIMKMDQTDRFSLFTTVPPTITSMEQSLSASFGATSDKILPGSL